MKIIFIADVHIRATDPKTAEAFVEFIKKIKNKIDVLYILGDFFEAWPGDDYITKTTKTVIQALKELTVSQTKIYFMRGNHDFLVDQNFIRNTSSEWIPDPFVCNIDDTKILLTHGDILFTQNISYRIYRAFVQNFFIRWLILKCLPLKIRLFLTNYLNKSSKYSGKSYPDTMRGNAKRSKLMRKNQKINQTKIIQFMKKYDTHCLVHGHLHRPHLEKFEINGEIFTSVSLGNWHQSKQNVLACNITKGNFKYRFISNSEI